MTKEEMQNLNVGDTIRNKGTRDWYVVTGNYGDHITAVKTVYVKHESDWDIIAKTVPSIPKK